MDVLSDVIRSAGLTGSLLTRRSFHERWGIRFPCERSAGFHIVTQGTCWVTSDRWREAVRLDRGDALFMGRGFSHELASSPGGPATDVANLPPNDRAVHARPPLTTLVCGVYQFRSEPIHPFFRE